MANANLKAAILIRNALASFMLCGITQAALALPIAPSVTPTSAQVETISLKTPHRCSHRHPVIRNRSAARELPRGSAHPLYEHGYFDRGGLDPYQPAVSANGEVHIPYTLSR
jgi:hypothetical protein